MKDYIIYDSRVIFTLNWLILTCENRDSFCFKYYPMPNGRNRIITDFDMNTIVNLYHVQDYENEEQNLYFSKKEAYFQYCNFIKYNVNKICGKEAKPYDLEMLLFTLADQEIFTEIRDNLTLLSGKTGF